MKRRLTTYTFDASEKTITLSENVTLNGFTVITNVTDNIIIYNFADPALGGSENSNVLTLDYDTSSMSDTDELQIFYDDGVDTVAVTQSGTWDEVGINDSGNSITVDDGDGSLTVDGTITANLGATDNAVLDSIASNTTGLAVETGGNLAAIKTNTDDIETLLTTIEGNQLPDGHNVTVDNASLTVDTGLTQPLTDTELRASAVEVDLGANNDVTVTSGAITETNSGAIKTAVEKIDDAIDGTEMQVDVVTMPTTTVESTDLDIRDLNEASDGVAVYGSDDGGTTKRIIKTDAGGAIQMDLEVASVTVTNESGGSAVNIQDGGNSITVDGTVDLGATDNAVLDSIASNTSSIDGHVDGVEALLGTIDTDTSNISTKIDTLAGAVAGTEVQVDVVASLPAGTNAIGKLAANSGVDIGDVDVLSVVPGTGSTNLGKAEDAAHASGHTGVMALGVRNDSNSTAFSGANGDYTPLAVDAQGNPQVDVLTMPTVTVDLGANNDVTVTSGAITETNSAAIKTAVETIDNAIAGSEMQVDIVSSAAIPITDNAGSITVDGTITAELSATDNAVLDDIASDTEALKGYVDGIEGLLTTIDADTGNMATSLGTLDNAISGSEMQVDIVASLPAGTNAIGKLSANSGVDIGDVDVASIATGTNAIGRVGHDITGIGHGVKTVTTAGTDVALASSTACKKVDIQAQTDNTGLIAVGGSGVDATEATGTGVLLNAGDFYSLEIDNLADIYIDSTINGDGVRFTYYT